MYKKLLPLLFFFLYSSILPLMSEVPEWEYLVLSFGKTRFYSAPTEPSEYILDNYGYKSLAYSGNGLGLISEAVFTQNRLDILGKEGWELVSTIGSIGGDQQFVLKRPLEEKIYDETLKRADTVYNELIEKLKDVNPTKPEELKTELIEYDTYLAEVEKYQSTKEKEEFIEKNSLGIISTK